MDSRTIAFTDFDLPRTIADSSTNLGWSFTYDAGHQRASKSETLPGGSSSSTIYVGKLYEKRTDSNGAITHVMYVYGERGAVVAQVTQPDGSTSTTVDYMHNDQLGSVANVTTAGSSTNQPMRFDPFGARIGTTSPPAQASNQLSRVTTGFTGQESEDDLGLINMNGRLYDPYLARFISADPMITRPWNSQEFNRYSYANNSPFRFVDTTGFQDFDFDFNFDFSFDYNFTGVGDLSGGGFTPATGMSGYGGACYGGTTGVSGADGLSGGFGNGGNVFVGAPVDDGLPSAAIASASTPLSQVKPFPGTGYDLVADYQLPDKGLGEMYAKLPWAVLATLNNAVSVGELGLTALLPPQDIIEVGGEVALVNGVDVAAVEAANLAAVSSVNPTNGTMNCVNCSIATDSTLAGSPASALPGGPTSLSVLENTYGSSFQPVSGSLEVGSILSQAEMAQEVSCMVSH